MGKKKEKKEIEEPSSPAWMTTYGDMMTLLLCFFVLLIAFAEMDATKFEPVMFALQGAFGVMPNRAQSIPSSSHSRPQKPSSSKVEVYQQIVKEVREMAEQMGVADELSIEMTEGGMLIRLGSKVLFDTGKDDIKQVAFPILDIVGKSINENARQVTITGHTDNIPINTTEFKSNWELSTARALSVVKYLIESVKVSPGILTAAGQSEFDPLVDNSTPENRQKNRRVEFLVQW